MQTNPLAQLVVALTFAVGAALFVGTGLALRHRLCTGEFPGQPSPDERGGQPRTSLATAWVKVVLGFVMTVLGLWGMFATNVF
jgi:hypothetical protein